MDKKASALKQLAISRGALDRALENAGDEILWITFIPKRNAFRKKAEIASSIVSRWSEPETELSEPSDDSDFGDEFCLDPLNCNPALLLAIAEKNLNETLFDRMQGSVQIRNSGYKFLHSVPQVSYGSFRDATTAQAKVICSQDPKHDEYFNRIIAKKQPLRRLPFKVIISTNGDSFATLRDLREKVLEKIQPKHQ
jgi:hypothetical protein